MVRKAPDIFLPLSVTRTQHIEHASLTHSVGINAKPGILLWGQGSLAALMPHPGWYKVTQTRPQAPLSQGDQGAEERPQLHLTGPSYYKGSTLVKPARILGITRHAQ